MKKMLLVIVVVVAVGWILVASVPIQKPKAYGITFSVFYAEEFGLNWQETFVSILDDLGIRHLRIPAYWNDIEKHDGVFDFTNLDWQITEAGKRNVDVVLALGKKLPRWPECHIPEWALSLPTQQPNQKFVRYIKVK